MDNFELNESLHNLEWQSLSQIIHYSKISITPWDDKSRQINAKKLHLHSQWFPEK